MARDDCLQPRAGALSHRRDDGVAEEELAELSSGRKEVEAAVDRWVWYAGWADKYAQTGTSNPVAAPYFNFTIPEPTGVVGIVAPDEPALDGLVGRLPVIVGGNTAGRLASESSPLAAIELAEALATSDVPGGVVNILTGFKAELAPWLAGHMDVNAIDVGGADGEIPSSNAWRPTTSSGSSEGGPTAEPVRDRSVLELKTVAPDRRLNRPFVSRSGCPASSPMRS